MERISLTILAAVLLTIVSGCSDGSPQVTAEEEARFKHPEKADFSKIPPDAFKPPKGPAFVGEPTKGSAGAAQPAEAKH